MKNQLFYKKSIWVTTLLTSAGFALLALRIGVTGQSMFVFLLWNLFLGILPLVPAYHFHKAMHQGISLSTLLLFLSWLFLFPNAPYMLTDFVHLHARDTIPVWFDASMLFCFSLASLCSGIVSLHWMHKGLDLLGYKWLSWSMVLCTIVLSGYGVFLGRVLRLNSWDVLFHTSKVWELSVDNFQNTQAIAMTMTFSIVITAVYGVFKIIRSSSTLPVSHETFLS